jgi:hypothetical protein
MTKDLESMKIHELDVYITKLRNQRKSNWPRPGFTYPDAYYRAVDLRNDRTEAEKLELRRKIAKAREEECEANKNAEMHELMIRGIRPSSAHELNNERA